MEIKNKVDSDPKLECKHCGSTDLEFKMWVNQDMKITDDCEENPYCNVCEEETRVKI